MLVDTNLYPKVQLPEESRNSLIPSSIFLFEPATDKYTQDERKTGKREISTKLLIDLISNEDTMEYINKLFKDEIESFKVYFVSSEGEYRAQFSFDKKTFVENLETLVFDLTPEQFKLLQDLSWKISFEALLKEKGNDIFDIEIDNNKYSFKVSDLLNFLQLEEQEFLSHMLDQNGEYKGFPITHFLYALKEYFNKNNIEYQYRLFDPIVSRLASIKSSQYIDIQAINKNLENNDYNFAEIEVNEDLKNLILKDMPPHLTPLEKAIYIYIKMCKVLTYDEEFYAVNQKGPVADRHEEISHVKKITPTNNRVVCYEFNAIYEKLLDDMGIISDVNQQLVNGFGGGHAYLIFREGKFLVKADSVTSILQGDILQAKLNQPLQGLKCLNKNQQTLQEFYQALSNVYSLIANQEKKLTSNEVGRVETFEEILFEYSKTTDSMKPVSVEEKMQILLAKVNSTRMVGIDALSYVLQLRKVLFTEQEQTDNFKVSIIRENTPNDEKQVARPKAIIALRVPEGEGNKVKYFIFYPNQPIAEVSLDNLQKAFDEKDMEYIAKSDPRMPDIVEGGPKK